MRSIASMASTVVTLSNGTPRMAIGAAERAGEARLSFAARDDEAGQGSGWPVSDFVRIEALGREVSSVAVVEPSLSRLIVMPMFIMDPFHWSAWNGDAT